MVNVSVNTFAMCEAIYNGTTPVNEEHYGTTRDVRPILKRSRKWEHIVKFSKNCYGLFDGDVGDYVRQWGGQENPSRAEMLRLAPILWERDKDGTETVTISNGTGSTSHNSRYSFLNRHIPHAMDFLIRNGKQYIAYGDTEYYLPKRITLTSSHFQSPWGRNSSNFTTRDDGRRLVFERLGDHKFKLISHGGEAIPVEKQPSTRVLKSKKAKYKKHIEDFWEWGVTMMPLVRNNLIGNNSWDFRRAVADELRSYGESIGDSAYIGSWDSDIPSNIAIRVLKEYNNTMRLNMLYKFLLYSDVVSNNLSTPEDIKKMRSQYNRWINKVCGFTKQVNS